MSPKRLSLMEQVVAKVKATPPRHKTWFDRLDESQREECLDIKRAWLAGDIKSSAIKLAEHISSTLRESGFSTVGTQGVAQWLRKRD